MTAVLEDAVGHVRAVVEREATAKHVPGVAVGIRVGHEQRVVGWGVTSLEHPLPVDGRTLFQVGSISKTITAAAVLLLAERGALDVDAPLTELLDGFTLVDPAAAAAITPRLLLRHAGGFHGDWLLVTRAAEPRSLADVVAECCRVPQLTPPDTAPSYSNLGFSLLGAVVERASGQPFARFVRRELLRPLGMRLTVTSADEAITHRVAMPHLRLDDTTFLARGIGWQRGWGLDPGDLPAGGYVSCVDDLLRWAAACAGGAPDVLPPSITDRLFASWGEALSGDGHIGASWHVETVDGLPVAQHRGETTGYSSLLALVPSADVGFVILTNGGEGARLATEVRRAVLSTALGLDVPPLPRGTHPVAPDVAGTYDSPFSEVHVTVADGIASIELAPHPATEGKWHPPVSARLTARADECGALVTEAPERFAGEVAAVGRDATGRVTWLRWNGRICPRR